MNASAPLRAKRCSRPASRPTTRTFLRLNSRASAMIEPVFPVAPKITYVASVTTAPLSLRLLIFVSPLLKFTDPLHPEYWGPVRYMGGIRQPAILHPLGWMHRSCTTHQRKRQRRSHERSPPVLPGV